MKKTKILYLITKSSWGGAQQYVFDLATHIDQNHYEPVVAVGGTGELYERLREAGLHTLTIKGLGRDVSFFKDLWATINIARIIFKEHPDVLHINSSKVGILGAIIGRLTRVPNVIFTAHGWAFNEERPVWQKYIIKFLQWLTVALTHTTIVVSNGTKADMNWPLIQKKMQVVHLGRTVRELKSRDEARGTLATKVQDNTISLYEHTDDFWIGSIAELHPTKCLNVAIDALALLVKKYPNLRYIIIHDGEERAQLKQQVKRLSLEQNVFFTGTLPNAGRLLKAFDLFVLPSRSEAFGYVLIEAGQAGIPVVATDVGGIPDIISHEETGLLVSPEDPEALAETMEKMLQDKALRTKLAAAHHERSATFSLENMISTTETTYGKH